MESPLLEAPEFWLVILLSWSLPENPSRIFWKTTPLLPGIIFLLLLNMLLSSSAESVMPDSPKFLLDENISRSVKRLLESKGFSAEYATKGIVNGKLASLSKAGGLVLVSRDSDFLNRSMFPPKDFFGIVVFVIHPPRRKKLVAAMSSLLAAVSEFKGKLFIVDEEDFEISG